MFCKYAEILKSIYRILSLSVNLFSEMVVCSGLIQ